ELSNFRGDDFQMRLKQRTRPLQRIIIQLPTLFVSDDILYRIRDSDSTHILTTASEAKRFSDFRNKLGVKGYFSVGTSPGFVSVSDFKKLNEDDFQELPVADVKKEAVALLYTSGTTGGPKAAEH
ncbi:unnamed protein product, partial [Ixodes persulcatus]